MREHSVGFLPVCDAEHRVVGVLTDRDIVVRACAANRALDATRVEAVMTKEVVSCRPSHGIRHAEALMIEHRKQRIVVIDEDHRLVGVISLSDVVQYEKPAQSARALAGVASRKYDPSSGLG